MGLYGYVIRLKLPFARAICTDTLHCDSPPPAKISILRRTVIEAENWRKEAHFEQMFGITCSTHIYVYTLSAPNKWCIAIIVDGSEDVGVNPELLSSLCSSHILLTFNNTFSSGRREKSSQAN